MKNRRTSAGACSTRRLDTTFRREWDKVAGRFNEILFQRPFEQTMQLYTEALGLDKLEPVWQFKNYEFIK